MNILSINLFKTLTKRASRLRIWLDARSKAEKAEEESRIGNPANYTLVDPIPGGRKLDLLMTTSHRHLDASRSSDKLGKRRWNVNNNEQVYEPRGLKLDPQLEYIYEELGLSKNLEPSQLTPPQQ